MRSAIAFALAIALLAGCDENAKWLQRSYESVEYSFTDFLDGIEAFPYAADKAKLVRVIEGFRRLEAGMHKRDVHKLMGAPDSEHLHYRPKGKGEEFNHSTWAYYLKRAQRQLATPGDEDVFLYFKPDDTLYWALPALPGLKSVGDPELYPEGTIQLRRRF